MQQPTTFFPLFGGAKLKFFIDFFLISFALLGVFLFVLTDFRDLGSRTKVKISSCLKFFSFSITRASKYFIKAIIRFESTFFWGMAIKMTSDGDAKEAIKFCSDQIEFTDTADDKSLIRGQLILIKILRSWWNFCGVCRWNLISIGDWWLQTESCSIKCSAFLWANADMTIRISPKENLSCDFLINETRRKPIFIWLFIATARYSLFDVKSGAFFRLWSSHVPETHKTARLQICVTL